MELLPVKTRRLEPPQDDFLAVLDEALPELCEGDVVIITSKVVAIHEGRCVLKSTTDKESLTREEAEAYLESDTTGKTLPLTIKHRALLYRGGVDEGNSGAYFTLLPEDPMQSAVTLRSYIAEIRQVQNIGVIISDSMVLPLRAGVTSVSLGHAGFKAHVPHTDEQRDLFGEPVAPTSTNIADSVAAASALVCGEADQSTPIVIARAIPNIEFTAQSDDGAMAVQPKKDLYYPLLKSFFDR